ncbi:MAG TPA: twin-arginine translocase subunit TatC [Tepidisphaeraceae bacterium]|nr:twin-arginine translocase subunit TatC [Tepidisphaeraceae bacterium]
MTPDPPQDDLGFDPDSFRMTVGEHLEELRTRLMLGLGGLFAAVLICLLFSERVMVFLCEPLNRQLRNNGLPDEMHYTSLTDPFMTYLKVTIIAAAAIAGPWIIYQAWQFVAAGLYPKERKAVTRYIPLSVTLFIVGLVFVYVVVLPLSIGFFLKFSSALSPHATSHPATLVDVKFPQPIPVIAGDPTSAPWGAMWYDTSNKMLKLAVPTDANDRGKFDVRVITLGPEAMMVPTITIGDYIDLVLTFMLTFGVAFQLPLVMLALVSIGIVDVEFLKKKRRVMFFGMAVAAAFLAPGDIVTSMLALLIPLVVLYEFGLILVKLGERRKVREAEDTASS